jgi:TAG lipase/steryl ester hydrolase/phospholipase A2/LPA acyltransferase
MSRQKQTLSQALAQASTYQEWLSVAQALDEHDGLMDWRSSDASSFFHESLIRDHIRQMQALRQSQDWQGLAVLLQESVYRHWVS